MKKTGLILAVLCCLAILGCSKSSLNEKRGKLLRTAVKSEVELQNWLTASNKTGPQGELREADTNGDGKIDDGDLTNKELRQVGVCKQWMEAVQSSGNAESWSLKEEPLKITCAQESVDKVDIIGTDITGDKLCFKTLSPE